MQLRSSHTISAAHAGQPRPSARDGAWAPGRRTVPARLPTRLYPALFLCLGPLCLLACRAGSISDSGEPGLYNAYWNCPTPSPVPTECSQEPSLEPTAGPGTPAAATPSPALECSTPEPTGTPYGLQMMPDAHTTSTFYMGQQVRAGPLRLMLTGYSAEEIVPAVKDEPREEAGPVHTAENGALDRGGLQAHVWQFEVANEGRETLTVTWPMRVLMREVVTPSGDMLSGRWGYTDRAGISSNAVWENSMAVLQAGETSVIRIPVEAPAGRGLAVGFAPDPRVADVRYDAGPVSNILWFRPTGDPHCQDNTSGPVTRPEQGGAVWQQPLSDAPSPIDGAFQAWPVPKGTYVSQDFGCTDFPEISGYDCPPGRPWFHAGVDFVDRPGTPLHAVAEGVVTYVGVSQGVRCTFPGAQEPRTNLGWMVVLQSGPYTIKYGHTIVGSERVAAGDRVVPGQVLALMGSTGCSTGPHLHFQVQRADQSFVDPFNLLGASVEK